MSPTEMVAFEFGGFTLNPEERQLLYLNEQIDIPSKDLDILLYLVRNPNRLISLDELGGAVWGRESKIPERTISYHIAIIRKTLGCEINNPTFIATVPKRGYRFVAKVQTAAADEIEPVNYELSSKERLLISANIFVPVYLGENAFDGIKGDRNSSKSGRYKVIQVKEGRLCILPTGIGVWHLQKVMRFPTISVAARWRRQTYDDIFSRSHLLTALNEQVLSKAERSRTDQLSQKIGKVGYAFSALMLEEAAPAAPVSLASTLRLLCCLTPLESDMKLKKDEERKRERRILESGLANAELTEFGAHGIDIGIASWDGVSYARSEKNAPGIAEDIIEFEIEVHAAWWLSKCLGDKMFTAGKANKAGLQPIVDGLRDQYARIKSIGENESPSERTMKEAILNTSRIEVLVNETLRRFESL